MTLDQKNKIGVLDPNGRKQNPLNKKKWTQKYKKLGKGDRGWSKLKVHNSINQKRFFDAIKKNQIMIYTAGTGVGKSSQIPKLVLHYLNYKEKIVITQPRQLPVENNSNRMAQELDVKIGEEVGYQHGNDKRTTNETKLLFITDGAFVIKALNDPFFSQYGSIIIDEAHERNLNIDILLYLVKECLVKKYNSYLKVVILSATANVPKFLNYFSCCKPKWIDIPGQKAKIEKIFLKKKLKDSDDLVEKVVEKVMNILMSHKTQGDILVFLPTKRKCDQSTLLLRKKILEAGDKIKDNILSVPFYAGLPEKINELIVSGEKYKSKFDIKVVFSTDVAETSLTIGGLTHVVDTGVGNIKTYDFKKRVSRMEMRFISRDRILQRIGRVGRTKPGFAHLLYTESQFKKLKPYADPQIYTESIASHILPIMEQTNLKNIKMVLDMLKKLPDPPQKEDTIWTLHILRELGCFSTDGNLTELGKYCAELGQIDPRQSKMLLLSKHYNCREEMVILVCMLQNGQFKDMKERFIVDHNNDSKEILKKFNIFFKKIHNKQSDALTLINLYKAYRPYSLENTNENKKRGVDWCKKNRVNHKLLKNIRKMVDNLKSTLDVIHRKKDFKIKASYKKKTNILANITNCLREGYNNSIGYKDREGIIKTKDNEESRERVKIKYGINTFVSPIENTFIFLNRGSFFNNTTLNILTNIKK